MIRAARQMSTIGLRMSVAHPRLSPRAARPPRGYSDAVLKSLVALSDVMCTGHHAAVSAGVKAGDTVAVVGDGAVDLCAVIAAKRLGAAIP
jgi:threonine dehydrogenase-like Zn-dependent dehydrogenase